MISRRWFWGLLLATLVCFIGCGAKTDTIKIGVAGPLTGDEAKMGTDVRQGVELAVAEWNNKGGVLGKQIVIVSRDDMSQEQQAQSVAKELVNEEVVGVIGHFDSGCTLPASKIYHEKMIPMITPSSTNPDITNRGFLNVFRVCGRDDQQGKAAADFAINILKAKRVAILHNKTQYGEGLAEEFKKALGKNVEVVYYNGFPKEELNFRPIIGAVKETNPDLWYFGGIYSQGGPLVVQARETGLTANFMSGDGVIDQVFLKTAGSAAEGSYFTFVPDPATNPAGRSFLEKYHQKYGAHGPYSGYAYDAANILLSAIQKAGTTDGTKICEQIKATAYDGAMGRIQFDQKGDIAGSTSNYIIWVVKNGKFIPYDK